eukprot:07740_5
MGVTYRILWIPSIRKAPKHTIPPWLARSRPNSQSSHILLIQGSVILPLHLRISKWLPLWLRSRTGLLVRQLQDRLHRRFRASLSTRPRIKRTSKAKATPTAVHSPLQMWTWFTHPARVAWMVLSCRMEGLVSTRNQEKNPHLKTFISTSCKISNSN